jgi:abortive infection bacteriophage resistance protein
MIEYVEISLRTRISYILAHNYGPMGYLQATHFKKQEFHGEFLSDLNREIKRSREVFIKHHKENYSGQIPIWVVTEIMSFGTLSKLFANMKNTDSNELSKRFYGVPAIYFKSWLRALSQLRNICAHYGRLYNRLFTSKPKLEKSDSESGILPNQLFSHILLLKKLMHETDWKSKSIELEVLIEEYLEVIDLDKLGFPIDWKTYI